ncbi:mechanosensitive ion channel family protein [Thalassomonas sp. M1454]|uniref:mechanosensitive ion channel family protein n=1 Tax=Thalassomonas sp. M1454 TaxID=2594477 RepID=UPI00117E269C|nr:mechanosensitive ion channel domain-containing protein [Thalassomonas sp. M1454]TRX53395.1 mechanosensitive ion channel [Thalassomonas sp. M1454]
MLRQFLILLKPLTLLIITLLSLSAYSQELTLKQVKEREESAKEAVAQAQLQQRANTVVGSTPLSTLLALADAVNNNDYVKASQFLDLRYLPPEHQNIPAEELVRQLVIVWGQQRMLDISTISDQPEGHLDDGLPKYRDLLGVLKSNGENLPIYLQRITDANGNKTWKISSNSTAKIPALWQEFGYHPIAESIARYLPEFTIADMQNWQFVSFILILFGSWYATAIFRWLMLQLVSYSDVYSKTMRRFIRVPLRLFLFFILLQWAVGYLGLSLTARVWLDSGTLSYLASMFLTLGIIEFTFALYVSKADQSQNVIAILKPLVTTLKIIMVIIIILNWFSDAGFNITTIVTGLGIGSLAVALAAQKSLENVFGAFTLFIARPIKPGDMCKFGSTRGRVEEIGLRSTKIRKLNRAVVHVPNSVIASMDLENITEIDNRQYEKRLRIRLETPLDKLKQLLVRMRDLLEQHPNIIELERYARLEEIGEDAFIIVINVYFNTGGRIKYKELEEKLNLQLLELLAELGIELAIPQQNISIDQASAKALNQL